MTFAIGGEQFVNLFRRVLQIGVERDRDLASHMRKTGRIALCWPKLPENRITRVTSGRLFC